ncbi:DUF4156 domain-containing protein [Agaribacterium haliotis]|uniref:DUF4156 domain-containing protein n=1 Tax=Agaribacterium haliotis TaxID=2013869 RepID=UPI000BB580D7|nr:DUF4156 domain-containing protein [Agaribacterium haliotis]
MIVFRTACLALITLTTACTWVKPQEGADNVALVKDSHVANCERLGKVNVAVKHDVVGLERKRSKVAEELLTLAKNEAVKMDGDSLVSLAEPEQGSQPFAVYRCKP